MSMIADYNNWRFPARIEAAKVAGTSSLLIVLCVLVGVTFGQNTPKNAVPTQLKEYSYRTSGFAIKFPSPTEPHNGLDAGTVERVGTSSASPKALTLIDPRNGHQYETIQIGTQVWMRENLAFLPRVCTEQDSDCGVWVYGFSGNDIEVARKTLAYQQFGVLYDWNRASRSCPAGWHLPSDEEWQRLEVDLGTSAKEAASSAWRGTNEGTALKIKGGSGFDAVLAGWRTALDANRTLPRPALSSVRLYERCFLLCPTAL